MKKDFVYISSEQVLIPNNSFNWKFYFQEISNPLSYQEIIAAASESCLISLGYLHYDWDKGLNPTEDEKIKIKNSIFTALIGFIKEGESFPSEDIFNLDQTILNSNSSYIMNEDNCRGKYKVEIITTN